MGETFDYFRPGESPPFARSGLIKPSSSLSVNNPIGLIAIGGPVKVQIAALLGVCCITSPPPTSNSKSLTEKQAERYAEFKSFALAELVEASVSPSTSSGHGHAG
jgi:hypothetical protein